MQSWNRNGVINLDKGGPADWGRSLPLIILAFVIVIVISSSVYSVDPEEVGVEQRFGRYVLTTEPGLHIKWPFPIEKVVLVKVKRVETEEFGMRTVEAGRRTRFSTRGYLDESLMLTGDLNVVDVRWSVQYRVKDPVQLLFFIRNPADNIRDVSEVVMRRMVGDYRVDEVLTEKRKEIADQAGLEMQTILDSYNTGVEIVTVKLIDVNPPDEVKPAFNEVNEAIQEKERVENQAWEAYNKAVPRAKGEAEKTIREAEGYSLDKINRAKGEVDRFLAVLEEYRKAPEITKKRLYLETLRDVLPKAREKYIVDSQQTSLIPLLDFRQQGGESK